jgi:hypothetical protein
LECIVLQRCARERLSLGYPALVRKVIGSPRLRRYASFALICLTLFVTALMPWSEIALTGDGFMLGGHDVELSILAFAVLVGMVLLVASRTELAPIFSFLGFTGPHLSITHSESMESILSSSASSSIPDVPLRI